MGLQKVLWDTDPAEVQANLQRYMEETKNESPDSAPARTIYLPLEPNTSTLFTRERIRLMEHVRAHGPLSIGELAESVGRSVDAVSRDLKFLANFGVLEIRRDQDDARRKVVHLAATEIRLRLL